MVGRLVNYKDNYWFIFIPPENDLFAMDMEITDSDFQFVKAHSLPIYKLGSISQEIQKAWKQGQKVRGEIIRENKQSYFQIIGQNLEEKEIPKTTFSKTEIAIQAILGNFSKVALTMEQYNYIKNLAVEENVITGYMSNGFCVNHCYVLYGTLNRDKSIRYPQLKRKELKKK